jgi:hypothetical protein
VHILLKTCCWSNITECKTALDNEFQTASESEKLHSKLGSHCQLRRRTSCTPPKPKPKLGTDGPASGLVSQTLQTPKPKEERVQQREKQGSCHRTRAISDARRLSSVCYCEAASEQRALPHLGRGEIPDGSPRASASPLLLLKKKGE